MTSWEEYFMSKLQFCKHAQSDNQVMSKADL